METKSLLIGLAGFILGGLVVSVAATSSPKPSAAPTPTPAATGMTMPQMSASLQHKSGDDFDKAFLSSMIIHHQGAIDMAKLSAANAKHDEIKTLSTAILTAQEQEIAQMKQWQTDWGYGAGADDTMMNH